MKQEEIYKDLKKIVEPIHAHSDQLLAIAKYVEDKINRIEKAYIKNNILKGLQERKHWAENGASFCGNNNDYEWAQEYQVRIEEIDNAIYIVNNS